MDLATLTVPLQETIQTVCLTPSVKVEILGLATVPRREDSVALQVMEAPPVMEVHQVLETQIPLEQITSLAPMEEVSAKEN